MMPGALDGIRVIDATNFVFGPVATQMLGDMGADVVKVEPPEGDPTRRIGAMRSPLMGSLFLNLNRNKRSIVLDLKQPDDLRALRGLIAGADVFVHNRRQGAISLIANTDAHWQRLFATIGREDLQRDARFATMGERIANADALYVLVEEALATRTTAQWIEALTAADIPAGPVNDLQSLRGDPHLADVGFFVRQVHESEGPLRYPGVPFAFGDSPGSIRRGPPRLGEHTAEVLGAIGGGSAARASG